MDCNGTFVKVLTEGRSGSVSFPVQTTCNLDPAEYSSDSLVVVCRSGFFLNGIDHKLPHSG
jgi:hypothetical protein